jgi:hypothetical protein
MSFRAGAPGNRILADVYTITNGGPSLQHDDRKPLKGCHQQRLSVHRQVARHPEVKQKAWAVFERRAALQPASDDEPEVWRFSPQVLALFIEW